MGTAKAGQWIVLLLIYFTVYFLAVFAVVGAKAMMIGGNPTANYTDPGFTALSSYDSFGGKCDRPNDITNYNYFGLDCEDLVVTQRGCNQIAGCNWTNNTAWFNLVTTSEVLCKGSVNMTIYNLTYGDSDFCTQLRNESICEQFTCTWSTTTELLNERFSILNPTKGISTFSETVKLLAGFKTQLGFQSYGWLWALAFTYLPTLMLFYSIYMAVRGA
jgi:hypothetical protein